MDPNTSYWQHKLASVAEGIVTETGADGVYLLYSTLPYPLHSTQ